MNLDQLVTLHSGLARLKNTPRKGWRRAGIPQPESVADHSHAVSVLAILLAKERGLDLEKVAIIAILHDLCESITGDITPYDGVSPKDKQRRERAATGEILHEVDPTGYFFELWQDYAEARTPEGRFVKDIDRLEMALQAHEYLQSTDESLTEFFDYAAERTNSDELRQIVRAIQTLGEGPPF